MLHGSDAFHRSSRAIDAPGSRYYDQGKFGRLFPALPPLTIRNKTDEEVKELLAELGKQGGPMDGEPNPDLSQTPASLLENSSSRS